MARSDKYEPLIQKYAKEYGVPPSLIREQIRSESNFNPRAVSSAGAAGLAQFMPKTGNSYGMKAIKKGNKWYATEDFFDPEKSIKAQAKYMSDIYNKQAGKDWGVTLAMYNMGPGRVKERGLESIFMPGGKHYEKETQGYVQRTLKRAGLKSPRIEETLATQKGLDPALYGTPALRSLKARQDKLKEELGLLSKDFLTEYNQDAESAYDAQPDLDLMRELAQRAYQRDTESSMAESNLASQLASLMNPAFAKQFQDQTTPRVNAARQYFSNLGMLNRQAMSASQSKARSRRRSDAQMQSLRGQIKAIEDQMGSLRELEIRGEQGQKKIQTTAEEKRKTDKAKPQKERVETPKDIQTQINRRKKELEDLVEEIKGDADEQFLAKMGGMDRFLPEMMKEGSKDPEVQRLRKKYKAQIDEAIIQMDALRLLRRSGTEFTEEQYAEAVERVRAQRDPKNLQPEALPIDAPAKGAADRFKKRREKGAQ